MVLRIMVVVDVVVDVVLIIMPWFTCPKLFSSSSRA